MPLISQEEISSNNPPAKELVSQSTEQPQPVRTWSAHGPQSGSSPSPFPRTRDRLTASANSAGELILFGGHVNDSTNSNSRSDLYMFSKRDFSTTLLQTSGDIPTPRSGHGAALIGTTFLVYGGRMEHGHKTIVHFTFSTSAQTREWLGVVVNGPGPGRRSFPTANVVGSKLFSFGGCTGSGIDVNEMWTFDLNCLKSQPIWELYEPAPGNEKPLPRRGHVSITTEDRIIIFGGEGNRHYYNDTWSFDISTRKWTELLCTGSIPSPRSSRAAVLVDGVMYVFGGFTGKDYLDDLIALQLSTQRWFKSHIVGPSPHRKASCAMASEGTYVFMLGESSVGAQVDDISFIHVFDTKDIKYPEPEHNAVNPNGKTIQLPRKPSTGPSTQEQPQRQTSSEGEVTRLELERRLSVSLSVQTERGHRIAQLADELTLKSALLEQAEVNAVETARRAGLEQREYMDNQRLMWTSLAKERDVELVDLQARLRDMQTKLNESLLSRDQQTGQYERELASVHAKLEAKESELEAVRLRSADAEKGWTSQAGELVASRDQQVGQYEKELKSVRAELEAKVSELEAVRLRLTDAEKGLAKSKAEADTSRAQNATGSMNTDEDQVTRRISLQRARWPVFLTGILLPFSILYSR